MIRLRITEAAARSIVEQADYYLEQAGTELALRWETSVDEAIRSLLNLPERGAPCRFAASALRQVRWIPIRDFVRHIVFYRYDKKRSVVSIVQVLHGARDLEAVLGDEE